MHIGTMGTHGTNAVTNSSHSSDGHSDISDPLLLPHSSDKLSNISNLLLLECAVLYVSKYLCWSFSLSVSEVRLIRQFSCYGP
jgi:hypothetical protein